MNSGRNEDQGYEEQSELSVEAQAYEKRIIELKEAVTDRDEEITSLKKINSAYDEENQELINKLVKQQEAIEDSQANYLRETDKANKEVAKAFALVNRLKIELQVVQRALITTAIVFSNNTSVEE